VSELQKRLDAQTRLQTVSGLPEAQVHFQPPTGHTIGSPAIIFSRDREAKQFADNLPYRSAMGYTVTVIHKDPDNEIRSKIAAMPYCRFNRWFASDGLNHDVFTIFL
jgi:hypothetical protein